MATVVPCERDQAFPFPPDMKNWLPDDDLAHFVIAAAEPVSMSAANGWFAARPSGTEDVYKIYAESFKSEAHLLEIQTQAQEAITKVLAG